MHVHPSNECSACMLTFTLLKKWQMLYESNKLQGYGMGTRWSCLYITTINMHSSGRARQNITRDVLMRS